MTSLFEKRACSAWRSEGRAGRRWRRGVCIVSFAPGLLGGGGAAGDRRDILGKGQGHHRGFLENWLGLELLGGGEGVMMMWMGCFVFISWEDRDAGGGAGVSRLDA